jgi:hypothetical protein
LKIAVLGVCIGWCESGQIFMFLLRFVRQSTFVGQIRSPSARFVLQISVAGQISSPEREFVQQILIKQEILHIMVIILDKSFGSN